MTDQNILELVKKALDELGAVKEVPEIPLPKEPQSPTEEWREYRKRFTKIEALESEIAPLREAREKLGRELQLLRVGKQRLEEAKIPSPARLKEAIEQRSAERNQLETKHLSLERKRDALVKIGSLYERARAAFFLEYQKARDAWWLERDALWAKETEAYRQAKLPILERLAKEIEERG